MVHEVRRISPDKNKPVVLSGDLAWPCEGELRGKSQSRNVVPESDLWRLDPYRALFTQVHHPRSQLLRAKKSPPNEQQWTIQGLMEQASYRLENLKNS